MSNIWANFRKIVENVVYSVFGIYQWMNDAKKRFQTDYENLEHVFPEVKTLCCHIDNFFCKFRPTSLSVCRFIRLQEKNLRAEAKRKQQ
jgi:hypothetical protein